MNKALAVSEPLPSSGAKQGGMALREQLQPTPGRAKLLPIVIEWRPMGPMSTGPTAISVWDAF